jgi:hypothetical protein
LTNCHNIVLFQQRITLNTQIYLAVTTVFGFGKTTSRHDVGLQALTTKIFGGCTKKAMFMGLFDLLFYFNDDNKILSSREIIQTLLVIDPGSLLSKVHNDNMGRYGPLSTISSSN